MRVVGRVPAADATHRLRQRPKISAPQTYQMLSMSSSKAWNRVRSVAKE